MRGKRILMTVRIEILVPAMSLHEVLDMILTPTSYICETIVVRLISDVIARTVDVISNRAIQDFIMMIESGAFIILPIINIIIRIYTMPNSVVMMTNIISIMILATRETLMVIHQNTEMFIIIMHTRLENLPQVSPCRVIYTSRPTKGNMSPIRRQEGMGTIIMTLADVNYQDRTSNNIEMAMKMNMRREMDLMGEKVVVDLMNE